MDRPMTSHYTVARTFWYEISEIISLATGVSADNVTLYDQDI